MFFGSKEYRISRDLKKVLIPTIQEIVHSPLDDMLSVCANTLSRTFDTNYICIHFTTDFGFPFEDQLPGLKYCPVATVSGDLQKEFLTIEGNLNELALRTESLVHSRDLPIEKWQEFLGYFRLRSGISVPLKYQDETYCIIDIYHTAQVDLNSIDLKPLQALGSCLYGAVKKEVMIKSLQEKEDIIKAFARTIEASDRYTGGHVDRVQEYSRKIGVAVGLGALELKALKISALLHDIGKIGIPETILNKPGPLTSEERELINQHPLIALDILGSITDPNFEQALDGILYHHERIDGQGYPHGLKGREIPLIARIIAIADTYDALTSDRSYRKGMDQEKAISILRECAGTQLDAELVTVFIKELGR